MARANRLMGRADVLHGAAAEPGASHEGPTKNMRLFVSVRAAGAEKNPPRMAAAPGHAVLERYG